MQKPILFLLLLTACTEFTAIAQDTTWVNANWDNTTPDKAAYFRIQQKTDSGWLVKEFYRSGRPQMTALFADDSIRIRQGESTWYNERGIAIRRCNYVQNRTEGIDIYYYDNGKKKVTGSNKAGEYDGEWLSYYPSGQIAGKASYANGKQISASFFHDDGTPDRSIKVFMKESKYPGGDAQLFKFLSKNIKYPDLAVKNNTTGTVNILFKVTKDGAIAEARVVQSVDKLLDAEALRVIRSMPDWEPAVMGGIPTDSYHKQPIVFRF